MRRLTSGNQTKFVTFALVIIVIILVLIVFLGKVLHAEKEKYEITKDTFIYDCNYEYVNLTSDAIIAKKWTGKYYLNEPETGLSYDLGNSVIAYDSIKNKINLYGTFFEVALDGEVTKTDTNTEIKDMLTSKLYKIDDRKYLVVSKQINTEKNTLTASNYLIVILDKSGNTLLLNDTIDIKTINAITLETDTFKFDVANEKMIYNDMKIDLKKIIGSTNKYVEIKKDDQEDKKNQDNKIQQGEGRIDIGANSSSNSNVNIGGTTVINNGGSNQNNNDKNSNTSIEKDNQNFNAVKSANLRGVTPGSTYLDVNYLITDPENKYQIVYLKIVGGNKTDTVSLDKNNNIYRITNLTPNTNYTITLGYKEIKNDNTIQEKTEDVLMVKTLKLGGSLNITKITPEKVYFNIKLDKNSNYDNATVSVFLNGVVLEEVNVNLEQALSSSGWTTNVARGSKSTGKLTIKVNNIEGVEISTSTQIY